MELTPPQIFSKLASYKSLAARRRLLASIPESNNFWFEAYHGLNHLEPYPYRFVLQQTKHQDRVDYRSAPNVLRMILDGMLSASLDQNSFIEAVTALSVQSRGDEWDIWFGPVLSKALRLPVSVSIFNEYAPEKYRVPPMPAEGMTPITRIASMPTEFYMEPLFEDAQRVFWFLEQNEVRGFLSDSTQWINWTNQTLAEVLNPSQEPIDLVLEGYMEESTTTLVDIGDGRVFRAGGPNAMPLAKRYEALKAIEAMLANAGVSNIFAVESHRCSLEHPDQTREHFNTIVQQGYNGALLRHDQAAYGRDLMRVAVMPTKKSILTCTAIQEGRPGTRYQGAAEYIIGKGTISRKKFTSPVFSGLTFEQRKTILEEKSQHMGRRFEVLSCGLGADNRLIFPVFIQWRNK